MSRGVEVVAHQFWVNPMEEAAKRYWKASRQWRGIEDCGDLTMGEMIAELREIRAHRGKVSVFAQDLIDDVVHDRRPNGEQTAIAANQ